MSFSEAHSIFICVSNIGTLPKTVTTTCPHCGNYTLEIHMNANTSSGFTHGNCTKCHYQPSVEYENDSFGTRIKRIG